MGGGLGRRERRGDHRRILRTAPARGWARRTGEDNDAKTTVRSSPVDRRRRPRRRRRTRPVAEFSTRPYRPPIVRMTPPIIPPAHYGLPRNLSHTSLRSIVDKTPAPPLFFTVTD